MGVAGSIAYGLPVLLKDLSHDPPTKFAVVNFLLSVFIGAVSGIVLTRIIGHHFPWTVKPEPYALAFIVGLAVNPNIPLLQKLASNFIAIFKLGNTK